MSHDLHVVAKRQPKSADLQAFLASIGGVVSADGQLQRGGYVLLGDNAGVHAEVDGPSRIEAEDVPDAASGAIGTSGWLVQISIKPSTDAAWPHALAVHLARAAEGVVYDPQEDRVTWPKGFQPRDGVSGEERIEEVELDWLTAAPSDEPDFPRRLLQLLREHAPEALPRRYGGYEPLPHRFEGERAAEDFVERWLEEAAAWPPMLFWSATRPALRGSAFMPTFRDAEPSRPGEPETHIATSFDGRAFARDPDFRERMVTLFTAVAENLGCFYAAAWVHRGVIMSRGRASADGNTETDPMPRSSRWVGLPTGPSWLAWFGPPYAALVRPSLPEQMTLEVGDGLYLRLGEEPMNADELAGRFPPLPTRLLARHTGQLGRWEPNRRYTLSSGPPSEPAAEIPPLR